MMRYLAVLFVLCLGGMVMACGDDATDETVAEVSQAADSCNCPAVVDPVCGKDGVTYENECRATCNKVDVAHKGHCDCYCPQVWDPVCGVDGKTYGNDCVARCYGAEIRHRGPCQPSVGVN